MREIKFRGRIINTVEWVEGNLLILEDSVSIRLQKRHPENGYVTYEVDPETVGEFTGLTDKNGQKIYEGDILNWTHTWESYDPDGEGWDDKSLNITGAVVYGNETGFRYDGNLHRLSDSIKEGAQIIGNIHDNPELLK